MAHGTKHLFPQLNGGELAVLYCFVFLFLAANGAGKWSFDAARRVRGVDLDRIALAFRVAGNHLVTRNLW